MNPLEIAWNHLQKQQFSSTNQICRQLIAENPGDLQAHHILALSLFQQQQWSEAAAQFRTCIDLMADFPEDISAFQFWFGLGVSLVCGKKYDEAVPCLKKALDINPNHADACNMLGDALAQVGRYEEALALFDRAIELDPKMARSYSNRAYVLDSLERLEESLEYYDKALLLDPVDRQAHQNRGVTLGKLARYREALADFDRSIQLVGDPKVRRNRALALLILGDLERGWGEFEYRWQCAETAMPAHPRPLWNGEPLDGRTILLHVEQGLGDTIQFIRYAIDVKARGGKVIVECQKPLVSLLETCPGIDRVIAKGSPLPEFDVHTPLMRLMGLMKTTLATIPAPIPYLAADASRVAYWRDKLQSLPGFKVGIAWQGNPKYGRDSVRSIPLKQFAKLAEIPGVTLISLQRGFGTEQLLSLDRTFPVVDLGDEVDPGLASMADTPAIMKNLDLIVTSDTALAHLAGATGLPVWIALRFAPDWRWLTDRPDTPWYPSAQLFRQKTRGEWEPVFVEMAEELSRKQ